MNEKQNNMKPITFAFRLCHADEYNTDTQQQQTTDKLLFYIAVFS